MSVDVVKMAEDLEKYGGGDKLATEYNEFIVKIRNNKSISQNEETLKKITQNRHNLNFLVNNNSSSAYSNYMKDIVFFKLSEIVHTGKGNELFNYFNSYVGNIEQTIEQLQEQLETGVNTDDINKRIQNLKQLLRSVKYQTRLLNGLIEEKIRQQRVNANKNRSNKALNDKIKEMVESNTNYFGLTRLPQTELNKLEDLEAIKIELLMDQVEKDRNAFLKTLIDTYGFTLIALKRKNSTDVLDNTRMLQYSKLMRNTMMYHLRKKFFLDRTALDEFMKNLEYFIKDIKRRLELDKNVTQTTREYEVLLSNATYQEYLLGCITGSCNMNKSPVLIAPLLNEINENYPGMNPPSTQSYTYEEIEQLTEKKNAAEKKEAANKEAAIKKEAANKEAAIKKEAANKEAAITESNNNLRKAKKAQNNELELRRLHAKSTKTPSFSRLFAKNMAGKLLQGFGFTPKRKIAGGRYNPRKTKKLRKTRRKQIKHTNY
jgi:hypothetical protein